MSTEGTRDERVWTAALGDEVTLVERDLPPCCRRAADRPETAADGGGFECPSCGAVWLGERGIHW